MNTLTGLIPEIYAAADKVSRELVGAIPASSMAFSHLPAAVNEAIRIPITRITASQDISPSMVIGEPTDHVVDHVDIMVTKSKSVTFGFVGEEQLALKNSFGYNELQTKWITQAMRQLSGEIEQDLMIEASSSASRAFGTAGTTPFASNLRDAAEVLKMMKDNGAPDGDLQLVVNTSTGVNIRSLTQLTNVNQSGSDRMLRQGIIADPIQGVHIRETGKPVEHTAGTGSGYVTSGALPVGTTVVPVVTGSGTVLEGDFITFAGDSNKYMVSTGVAAPGSITIAPPGLRTEAANATAVTVGGDYSANVAFDRDALQLVARPPAIPEGGDDRDDSVVVTDPVSGISFEVSRWSGNRKVRYEVAMAWGVKNIKREHGFLLLG